jgi:hypothetical protein
LFIDHRFAYDKASAVMLGLLWTLTLSAILRCAAIWLFRVKLTLRQEAAFWIVVPASVFLAFVAPIVQNAILTRHLLAVQSLIEKLQLEQRPRHLSEKQIDSLKTQLAPAAGQSITVWCSMGDAEACSYAQELLQAFRDAKWRTDQMPTPSILRNQGTSLLVDDRANLSQMATFVESALRKSNVPIGIIQFRTDFNDTVVLFVGPKETD